MLLRAINYCFFDCSDIIVFNIILILDYLLVWCSRRPIFFFYFWRMLRCCIIGDIMLTSDNSHNRFSNEVLFFTVLIGFKRSVYVLILNFPFFVLSWVFDLIHENLEREYCIGLDVDILNVDCAGAGLINVGFESTRVPASWTIVLLRN